MNDSLIKPDQKALEAALVEARKRLAHRPDSWFRLESVGRILCYLGDPQATDYFRKAIANYKFNPKLGENDPGDHLRIGNLHRLSGDDEMARRHFQHARGIYAEYLQKYSDPALVSMYLVHLIMASFLLGQDEEVVDIIERLRAIEPDIDLIAYPIAKLASARHNRDSRLAEEAVDEVVKKIRRDGAKVWDCGGVSLWDWYEIALAIWQEIKK